MMIPAFRLLPTYKPLAPMKIAYFQYKMIRQHYLGAHLTAPVDYYLFFWQLAAGEEVTRGEADPDWFHFGPDFGSEIRWNWGREIGLV